MAPRRRSPSPRGSPRKGARSRSRSDRGKKAVKNGAFSSDSGAYDAQLERHQKITPSLLRIFYKFGGHHSLNAFAKRGQEPADEELQVYVWMDVTLNDLVDLVQDVLPDTHAAKKLHMNLVYPDKTGKMVFYEIGEVGTGGPTGQKTLEEVKLCVGDFLDLSIIM